MHTYMHTHAHLYMPLYNPLIPHHYPVAGVSKSMFGGTPQSAPPTVSLHVGFEMCFLDTGESGDKWPLCVCINGLGMLPVSILFKLYVVQAT